MNPTRMAALSVPVLFLSAFSAQAGPDYVAINSAFTKTLIVPAYDQLANTTAAQADAWEKACSAPGKHQPATLKEAYHQVADAWAGVFHWNFGPVTLLLRRDRFYHWPERRNSISKGLARLLAKPDYEKLKPENFTHISVAVQGLPVMERLLFEHSDAIENDWVCRIGQAIATNLSTMAKGAAAEWRADILPLIEHGKEHPIYFDGPKATLSKFLTELLTGFAIIKDQKILPVMGASAEKAKPGLIEARRSGRFAQNLALNLKVLLAADAALAKHLPQAEARSLTAHRKTIMSIARSLPPIGHAVYDQAGRIRYQEFTSALTAFRADMARAYSKHLGLVVGFNSLDGD